MGCFSLLQEFCYVSLIFIRRAGSCQWSLKVDLLGEEVRVGKVLQDLAQYRLQNVEKSNLTFAVLVLSMSTGRHNS